MGNEGERGEREAELQEERCVPEGHKGSSKDRECIPMSLNLAFPFFPALINYNQSYQPPSAL